MRNFTDTMKKINYILLALFASAVLYSCGGEDEGGGTTTTSADSFDRSELLTDLADLMIIPSYQDFSEKVSTLSTQTAAFTATPSENTLVDVREAFKDAYLVWQYVGLFEIGHAEEVQFQIFTNGYPTDTNAINTNIASGLMDLSTHPFPAEQGLPAIEYLLYAQGSDSETINLFTEDQNYGAYLIAAVDKLQAITDAVLEDWQSGYREEFISLSGNAVNQSVNKIVNDYVFFYEKTLRTDKIGVPAGRFSGDAEPRFIEARYVPNNFSLDLFNQALDAAQNIYNGDSYDGTQVGESFSSYLTALDATELESLITDEINEARIEASTNLTDDFTTLVESSEGQVAMLEVFDELQDVVILIKTNMMQEFGITPDFVDGDGD